jgi:exonuclease SbcD
MLVASTRVRILHLADVHLDRPFVGVDIEARKRRHGSLRGAFERCLAAAADEKVDLVTIGGDLWEDESVSENTRSAVAYELGKLPCPVLVICGNHDPLLPGGNYDQTRWPTNVQIFRAGELQERRFDGVSVWGVSWGGGALSASFLDSFHVPADGRTHLLLLHGTSARAAYAEHAGDYCSFDPGRVHGAGFALCLAGHVHAASAADRVIYPGSPEPLGWGDVGEHCYAVVSATDGVAQLERLVQVNETRYEVRALDCEGVESDAEIRDKLASLLATDGATSSLYLRVELTGEVARGCVVDPQALAEPYQGSYGAIAIVDNTVPAFDYQQIATRPTADGLFVRDLLAQIEAVDDPASRRVLSLALRAGLRSLEDVNPLLSVTLPGNADQ